MRCCVCMAHLASHGLGARARTSARRGETNPGQKEFNEGSSLSLTAHRFDTGTPQQKEIPDVFFCSHPRKKEFKQNNSLSQQTGSTQVRKERKKTDKSR